jgi:hypothetical protein
VSPLSGNPLDRIMTNLYSIIQASYAGISMTPDETIFGLRFRTNGKLQLSIDGLKLFLDSPTKEDKGKLHGDDLAAYRDLLKAVESFERDRQGGFHDRMLFTVLGHSHIVKPALKSAVEQYKYHFHNLSELDLKKPSAFIKSAEEEIARLDAKKKEEVVRKGRLAGMVADRKQVLDVLTKKWHALAEELNHIIAYIKDNLVKIEKLTDASIAILEGEKISRKKEGDLIEDIKTQFKERLRTSLYQGTITRDDLEKAKEEVSSLSKRTADLIRTDVYTLTQLYVAIHGYCGKACNELDRRVDEIQNKKHASFDEDLELYALIEKILVSFTMECRFEIKAADIGAETEHDLILMEKRKEMLEHLFDLLRQGAS